MSEARPRLYLLDVEGTVAPLSLTTEVLFPYARAHFSNFLAKRIDDPAVRADLALLYQESLNESDADSPKLWHLERGEPVEGPGVRDAALAYLLWLMDRDRKSTALKSLQGKIWKAGFESGELKGTLFADVPEAFRRWSTHAKIAIYSSGSTEAQQLLFRYSNFGDLTPMIAGYFDTRIGPKRARDSYAAIAAAMQVAHEDVLFFSDVVEELDAACDAGSQTRLVVREGNAPVVRSNGHPRADSFDQL